MMKFILMLIAMVSVAVLSVPALMLNTLRKLYRREKLKEYFHIVALGFDQAGGSILYGQEDWTVSSWTFYLWRKSEGMNQSAYYFMRFINTLFLDQKHCEDSFYNEAQKQNFKPEWM